MPSDTAGNDGKNFGESPIPLRKSPQKHSNNKLSHNKNIYSMKRFYFLLLALLTLAVQAATVKIGYTKTDGDLLWAYDGFGQPPTDMKMGAAIRITR